MSLRIQTNVEAFRAHRNLANTQSEGSKSMEKLSSGFRINRAADDAAGLAISESLRAQVRGLSQAARNVSDGISLVQTAEGSLEQVHAMLQRTRELAVQYKNGTLQGTDTAALQAEADALEAEVTRITDSTEFNGISLNVGGTIAVQVGTGDNAATNQITVTLSDLATDVPAGTFDLDDADILASIDEAIDAVSTARGTLGAVQNRLEYTLAQIGINEENLSDSLSRIKDVDMASEMVKFTKSQILAQAGTAMLAQANQAPQTVLQLLR